MLPLTLVLIVGLGSVGLYLTAYIYPEIHRKSDIWWSGIGLVYALVLLIYQRPLGLLLGHTASVLLLVWLSYQALQRRWAMVEVNPPQPEPGTISARTRKIFDQLFVKIVAVDWQGLWQRLGTQSQDGTAEKSILPANLKQRFDFSGLGQKLKGMIGSKGGGKGVTQASSFAKAVEPIEVSRPAVDSTNATTPVLTTAPSSSTQPDPVAIPKPPADIATQDLEQSFSSSEVSLENPAPEVSDSSPIIEVEPVSEGEEEDLSNAKRAELEAELDQVISNLSPEEQEAAPSLPQPPDPLG